jgi:transposase
MNLNGTYNPNTQDVIIREDDTINAQSTIKLFKQIEDYYSDKKVIYAILDNTRYYRSKIATKYLEHSKIKTIFLPSCSPNLIERLWKFMRKKVINTSFYESFDKFREAVRNFFKNIHDCKNELEFYWA